MSAERIHESIHMAYAGLCRPTLNFQETHLGNTMYGKKNKQREFSENRMVKLIKPTAWVRKIQESVNHMT